jgi:CelD/BcsL family acetyltransferase involved in cellulose biosynthesis
MSCSVAARQFVRHFGGGTLSHATLVQGGEPMAHALVERRGAVRLRIFAPSQAPAPLIVARPGVDMAVALVGLVRSTRGTALLLDVPKNDHECLPLAPGERLGFHEAVWGTTISVNGHTSFPSYWDTRSKELRSNVRRYLRRAEGLSGGTRFSVSSEPGDISEAVQRYGMLESRGWKGREGTAIHPDNLQGRFYRALLEAFALDGQARVYELYIGESLAASRLMVRGDDMLVALKTTYDESLRAVAPGRLVSYSMLQHALSEPHPVTIEFYTRADQDAMQWATHVRPLTDVTLYRDALVGRVASVFRKIKRLQVFARRKAAT